MRLEVERLEGKDVAGEARVELVSGVQGRDPDEIPDLCALEPAGWTALEGDQ